MSFIHAVEKTRKDKTRIFENKEGELYVNIKDEKIVIRTFVFYKSDSGILENDDDKIYIPATYIKHCPTMKIPVPVIRRLVDDKVFLSNKFFLSNIVKDFFKSGDLFMPFLYFYFEESSHEEQNGYLIKTFPKYSSKIDRNFTFIHRENPLEREDEKLKEEAIEIYIKIKRLEREQDELREKLDRLDHYGKLRSEFNNIEKKLLQKNGGEY